MTTAPPPRVSPAQEKIPAASILGAVRRPITRYRPVVIGGGIVSVLLLVGLGFAVAFGGGHRAHRAAVAQASPAEAAAGPDFGGNVPTSYADTTAPGTLSLAQTATDSAGVAGQASRAALSPDQQHAADLARTAREGGPFFGGAPIPLVTAPRDVDPTLSSSGSVAVPSLPAPTSKQAFVDEARAVGDVLPAAEHAPLSPYEVKAGTVIPAALLSALNSDLPGEVVAQVTQPVFDHVTGRVVLIPQGARLIGRYDSQVTYGQGRILLVWNRLILPDGRSITLGSMIGVDASGASGLSDKVDTHLPLLMRAVGLSTLITLGGAVAQDATARSSGNLVIADSAGGVSQAAAQVGQRFVDRDLNHQPTLTVRPGFRVDVLVSNDLVLEPYVAVR
jgi:type IV secretory pathway VirB10-like protein